MVCIGLGLIKQMLTRQICEEYRLSKDCLSDERDKQEPILGTEELCSSLQLRPWVSQYFERDLDKSLATKSFPVM